jgi:hypothetical protein
MLDCRLSAIAEGSKERLGTNLKKKLSGKIPGHEKVARDAVTKSRKSDQDLKELWDHQKRQQLSVRARESLNRRQVVEY